MISISGVLVFYLLTKKLMCAIIEHAPNRET